MDRRRIKSITVSIPLLVLFSDVLRNLHFCFIYVKIKE